MAELNIQRGARVVAGDGELGLVTHVIVHEGTREVTDLVVKHGIREFTVPVSTIARDDGGRIMLRGRVSDYRSAPAFLREQYHGGEATTHDENEPRVAHGDLGRIDDDDDAVDMERAGVATTAGPHPSEIETSSPYRLQLREEHLRVVKQPEQVGMVVLGKRVTEQIETVTVPVREERLVIERVPGNGEVVDSEIDAERPESIVVSLMKERVNLVKEAIIAEEVNVRKEAVERDEVIEATVRREELVVDDEEGLVEPRSEAATPFEPPSRRV